MKLIKYVTRNYSLRDHVIMVQSLYKKNSSIPELYYTEVVDVSIKGLMDIYINQNDLKNNTKRLQALINKPGYLTKKISEGKTVISKLKKLPFDKLKTAHKLSNQEIIKIIKLVIQKQFEFGGFLEFTHYLDRANARLSAAQIKNLGYFHDQRKEAFISAYNFLNSLLSNKLKDANILNKKLNFLTTEEIIDYFSGKISDQQVNQIQKKRMRRYICIYKNQKEKIVSEGFDVEFVKIKKSLGKIKLPQIIKGQAINTGTIRGKVKIITQNTPYNKIPKNSIIVTQMSTPEMTPFLKSAKALITDEGGLLCHAAIFAREFKIVTILGTKIATKILKDGDLVEINTSEGTAKKIK